MYVNLPPDLGAASIDHPFTDERILYIKGVSIVKRVVLLGSLLLCASGVYATVAHPNRVADGKKRNEDAYEQMLKQTGWKSEQANGRDDGKFLNGNCPSTPESISRHSPSKSS